MRNLQDVLTNQYGLGSELVNWNLLYATGISTDGTTIVGTGGPGAWIATIPEPGTGLLVMAGVLGLAIRRRGQS
jgi:hypothetical protein